MYPEDTASKITTAYFETSNLAIFINLKLQKYTFIHTNLTIVYVYSY